MASVLTSAVQTVTPTLDMDFATVLGLFTSGKVSPEAFTAWQAAAAVPAANPVKGGAGAKPKAATALTRAMFEEHAKPLDAVIDGKPFVASPKQFSTGSLGFNTTAKVKLRINGVEVTCQLGLNLTICGSKELA